MDRGNGGDNTASSTQPPTTSLINSINTQREYQTMAIPEMKGQYIAVILYPDGERDFFILPKGVDELSEAQECIKKYNSNTLHVKYTLAKLHEHV